MAANEHEDTGASEMGDVAEDKKNRFRWNQGEKVLNLIQCLGNYKSAMEYRNVDFNADKVKQYEAVRQAMAEIYSDRLDFFGPVSSTEISREDAEDQEKKVEFAKRQKTEKELIKRGYNRIHEKLNEIRKQFSNAVTTGSRSGSGTIVLEFFDQLTLIWGGSPSTNPLAFGISSDQKNEGSEANVSKGSADNFGEEEETEVDTLSSTSSSDKATDDYLASADSPVGAPVEPEAVIGRKRKYAQNPAPRLIDNKRKHMERQLSAAQRDQLLLNESKEDAQFKRDMAEAIRQSNETFATAIQQMSMSIMQVAQGMARSMEMMSNVICQQNQQQLYQSQPTFERESSFQRQGYFPQTLSHSQLSRQASTTSKKYKNFQSVYEDQF